MIYAKKSGCIPHYFHLLNIFTTIWSFIWYIGIERVGVLTKWNPWKNDVKSSIFLSAGLIYACATLSRHIDVSNLPMKNVICFNLLLWKGSANWLKTWIKCSSYQNYFYLGMTVLENVNAIHWNYSNKKAFVRTYTTKYWFKLVDLNYFCNV